MKIETEYNIGDSFRIIGGWEAACTAITIRASRQIEYQLEWIGDAEFKGEWLTAERIRLLNITHISE